MHDIAVKVLSVDEDRSKFNIEYAKGYHTLLDKWYRELPDALQPKNIVLPGQLQLQ
jgi:hypothetical protein